MPLAYLVREPRDAIIGLSLGHCTTGSYATSTTRLPLLGVQKPMELLWKENWVAFSWQSYKGALPQASPRMPCTRLRATREDGSRPVEAIPPLSDARP